MKVIFVIGAAHTGTTWLCLVLGASQGCMPVGELCRTFRDHRYKTDMPCVICGGTCKAWNDFKKNESINEIYKKAFQFLGVSMIVDSSKKIWIIEDCTQFEIRIVHLVRNIYDSMYHYYARGKNIKAVTKKWCKQRKAISDWLKGKKHITIDYEKAFQSKVLKRVCNYVGIEYNENMLRYWEKPIHPILGAKSAMLPVNLYHDLTSPKVLFGQQQKFYKYWNYQTQPLCLGKLIPDDIKRIIDKNAN